MDSAARIKLVNDLIRENRECTIRTYLDCLKEIEGIEKLNNIEIVRSRKIGQKIMIWPTSFARIG